MCEKYFDKTRGVFCRKQFSLSLLYFLFLSERSNYLLANRKSTFSKWQPYPSQRMKSLLQGILFDRTVASIILCKQRPLDTYQLQAGSCCFRNNRMTMLTCWTENNYEWVKSWLGLFWFGIILLMDMCPCTPSNTALRLASKVINLHQEVSPSTNS